MWLTGLAHLILTGLINAATNSTNNEIISFSLSSHELNCEEANLNHSGLNKDTVLFNSFVILLINVYIYSLYYLALSIFTEHCFLELF